MLEDVAKNESSTDGASSQVCFQRVFHIISHFSKTPFAFTPKNIDSVVAAVNFAQSLEVCFVRV